MRIISGMAKSTPKHWLPVLYNIFNLLHDAKHVGLVEWRLEWKKSNPDTHNLVQILGNALPGYQLAQRDWVFLNR
jgi:hypothetical protein